jgi:hypothetical protein
MDPSPIRPFWVKLICLSTGDLAGSVIYWEYECCFLRAKLIYVLVDFLLINSDWVIFMSLDWSYPGSLWCTWKRKLKFYAAHTCLKRSHFILQDRGSQACPRDGLSEGNWFWIKYKSSFAAAWAAFACHKEIACMSSSHRVLLATLAGLRGPISVPWSPQRSQTGFDF